MTTKGFGNGKVEAKLKALILSLLLRDLNGAHTLFGCLKAFIHVLLEEWERAL